MYISMHVEQSIHWVDSVLKLRFCNYILSAPEVIAEQL